MEIDLNYAVIEAEKTASCNGECGKGAACVCSLSSPTCSSSGSSSASVSSSYLELWHACAGPLTSLPKKGNVVVYFPQGHLEQASSFAPFSPMDMPTYDLQPQIFCRVVNIQLLVSSQIESELVFYLLNSFKLAPLHWFYLFGLIVFFFSFMIRPIRRMMRFIHRLLCSPRLRLVFVIFLLWCIFA